ncbi:MAG: hypothetical protein ACREOK_01585 [Gemmatimonadaceae bacterium]
MPKSELHASRPPDARAAYSYRRELGVRELLPAFGIAVAAGLFAFYVTRLMLQRTPLLVERGGEPRGGPRVASKRGVMTRGGRGKRVRLDHPAA